MSAPPALLAVPNVSEGRDLALLDALERACARAGARVLDRHTDPDHDRAVLTLAAPPRTLSDALVEGARVAVERIDVSGPRAGVHPHIGALDVAPIVFPDAARRGAACAEALVLADRLGDELGLPVLLYGALAGGRTRAELRRGGPGELARRLREGGLRPDFGPPRPHPTAGAVLVAARPPLVAFNLLLAPEVVLEQARDAAARLRASAPGGLPGVQALGLPLRGRDRTQLSFNVEDPRAVPLARLVERARALVPVAQAELVGLAPAVAFEGFPDDLPIPGFDPARHLLEQALPS